MKKYLFNKENKDDYIEISKAGISFFNKDSKYIEADEKQNIEYSLIDAKKIIFGKLNMESKFFHSKEIEFEGNFFKNSINARQNLIALINDGDKEIFWLLADGFTWKKFTLEKAKLLYNTFKEKEKEYFLKKSKIFKSIVDCKNEKDLEKIKISFD